MTDIDSTGSDQVLKVDRRGRVRSTAAHREAVLAQFERSGLSGMKFAALAGVNYQTFAGWLAKRRRASHGTEGLAQSSGSGHGAAHGSLRWVEAVVGDGSAAALVVEWRGGMRLEIKSAAQVPLAAALLKALQAGEGWPC